MASYTYLGQELWLWAPYLALSLAGRQTWLALWSSPNAKRTPPGLWAGSELIVAEAVHLPLRDTMDALVELEDHRLIEWDRDRRVIAMTRLPDRCEKPSSGAVLKKWWNSFRGVQPCPTRDRWIEVLAWLCFPANQRHDKLWSTWETTFGTICPEPIGLTSDRERFMDKQCALPFSAHGSGVLTTKLDTLPDTPRIRMRDQGSGSGIRVSEEGSGASEPIPAPTWSRPPPIIPAENGATSHLRVGKAEPTVLAGGFLCWETQEHDADGNPWGPEGPPKDRFINGRRRNL